MDELNQNQPELGETILCCGHLEEQTYHFFDKPGDEGKQEIVTVVHATCGHEFKVRWIILCDDCTRQRTKHDGVHPFSGPLHRGIWAPEGFNASKN